MVSVIENWTDMEGTIIKTEPSKKQPNFTEANIKIEKTTPVEDFANLLEDTTGKTITVLIPNQTAAKLNLTKNTKITFRARTGMNTIYAHPDLITTRKP